MNTKSFLIGCLGLLLLTACDPTENRQDPESLILNRDAKQLEVNQTFQLEVINTTDPVEWSSQNEQVATVTANGLVTALNDGRTYVVASQGKHQAKCQITVVQEGGSYKGEYALVWAEEFDGPTLNTADWNIEVSGFGGGNNEAQYYTDRPSNLRIEDGVLVLEARKEEYEGKHYTSARINSQGKHQFPYCKAEARIWLPSGRGTWPAFWMLGTKSSWPLCGEIDIMEHIGSQPTMISHALHTREKNGSKGNNWSSRNYQDGIEGSWHTYAMEWLESYMFGRDAIRFWVDDQITAFVTEPTATRDIEKWPFFYQADFQNEFYLILNLAIGGNMGGSIDDNIFASPVQMKVDWVRIYQKKQ